MDHTDYFNDVRLFHEKFGLSIHPSTAPRLLDQEVFNFRLRFLEEETIEFIRNHTHGNLAEAGDALVDLVYVALGTAHMMGLPFDLMWRLVQEKNMQKERANGHNDPRSKRGSRLDVVKPAGWTPPDHRPIIEKALRDHAYTYRTNDSYPSRD